eukprot:Nitzschia sp. Nitz4//scaffold9_size221794//186231//186982//NITZ4_001376-RA/size221794-snap-gene-0.112-mRNA-1//1//CDS//3329561091//3844//frame0
MMDENVVADQQPNQHGILERYKEWCEKEPLRARCVTFAVVGALGALLGARTNPKSSRSKPSVDWLEVIAFALHGGLVAGPLSQVLREFVEETFYDSPSNAVMFNQIIAQPPQLLLMFAFVDVTKTALASIPSALGRSSSLLAHVVADSWKFWPLVIYLTSKTVKRKKHSKLVLNVCSILWATHLARYRSRNPTNR